MMWTSTINLHNNVNLFLFISKYKIQTTFASHDLSFSSTNLSLLHQGTLWELSGTLQELLGTLRNYKKLLGTL